MTIYRDVTHECIGCRFSTMTPSHDGTKMVGVLPFKCMYGAASGPKHSPIYGCACPATGIREDCPRPLVPKLKWISVEEALPEEHVGVLVYGYDEMIKEDFYAVTTHSEQGWGYDNFAKITHWMPLPAPPKEGE